MSRRIVLKICCKTGIWLFCSRSYTRMQRVRDKRIKNSRARNEKKDELTMYMFVKVIHLKNTYQRSRLSKSSKFRIGLT